MMPCRSRVFYFSHATPDVYTLIGQAAGDDFELLTLHQNNDVERMKHIAVADYVICAAHPLRQPFIEAASRLKLVHHQGVGWQDTIDWHVLKERHIPLALTPEGTTIGVAEHTILLMLAAAKRLSFADRELREGRWHINSLRAVSRELCGKTIGYVGMGRIAQAVAERLMSFGCSGIYVDPYCKLDPSRQRELGLVAGSFDDVLSSADILTLHIPLTEQSRLIIGGAEIARMKKGAILVNTARGGLVDDLALAAALAEGQLLAAGLDVFENEPPRPDHPLMQLPNVVLTPHIAAGTEDAMSQKMQALFENLRRFERGEPLKNRVELW
jgi:phosphoglycerate dehydrogenase-like enzyme